MMMLYRRIPLRGIVNRVICINLHPCVNLSTTTNTTTTTTTNTNTNNTNNTNTNTTNSNSNTTNNNNNKNSNNDESWLSKHSGKIGISALVISVTLIYRYFNSMTMRSNKDSDISNSNAIDPYEYNQLKYDNNISVLLYDDIVNNIIKKYSNSHSNSSSYNDFISNVNRYISIEGHKYGVDRLRSGHLLDRILLKYLNADSSNTTSIYDEVVDVEYLLVLLSMTVKGPAEDKIKSLYKLINNNDDSSSTTSSSISKERVIVLLQHLVNSCQIPSEKQVIETGVNYPLVTYRQKTPAEMVKSYCDVNKYTKDTFDYEEFQSLLLSGSVCAWGECYRSR